MKISSNKVKQSEKNPTQSHKHKQQQNKQTKKYPLVYDYLSRHLINSYGDRFSEAYSKRDIPLPA